ncbi:MAG TPA: ATP-binding protein [Acidimicrobiia bacterium]|nr:ATP-binding protein [Acidimicrobiia bacterium]
MPDYKQGVKKDVSEIKFLIHDLRVERFIDEVIHFHVTLDTDLQLHGIADPLVITGDDLRKLRTRAASLRLAYESYSQAVGGFAAPETVLANANEYVRSIHDLCELILHPMWSHIDAALAVLPDGSRSVRSRSHYRNVVRWLCGVYYRIEHFWAEQRKEEVYEVFDLGADLEDYVRNVVHGWVTEQSAARVELQLGRLDPAVLGGNRHRFRRMYFNLIMNAVDAMSGRKVGELTIEDVLDDGHVNLSVRDNGAGMTPERVQQLLADKESLDGELHSLGFVFVRQTVEQFNGTLSISSRPGAGTTTTVRVPVLQGAEPPPRRRSLCEDYDLPRADEAREGTIAEPIRPFVVNEGQQGSCGQVIYSDFSQSQSQSEYPGCIFALAISEDDRLELFAHKPYERLWNMGHEDLLPTFFEATIRGRLEEDENHTLSLILKAPQNMREYWDFKEVPVDRRTADEYVRMVRDEIIRIARRLTSTGLPETIMVEVAAWSKFFPETEEPEACPVARLAGMSLSTEERGS